MRSARISPCCAVAVTGAGNGPGDAQSEAWLQEAEAHARAAGAGSCPPHVAAWQDAYRAFGAKPQRTALLGGRAVAAGRGPAACRA